MDRDILILPAETGFDALLAQSTESGPMRHIVVTRGDRVIGVLRVNTALRRGLEGAYTGVALGDVANRNFTIAREEDIMFGIIGRMWQRGATMAVVVRGSGIPRAQDVVGVIAKEHIADSVADSIRPYAESKFQP
jgi:CIC family chloride channel protein